MTANAGVLVEQLRCEYLANPLGIDVIQPRLCWTLQSVTRGEKQTAYQILVAGSEEKLAANQGDLWDSGKVISDATSQIPYAGSPLNSSQQVFWKVRAYDQSGKPSVWSDTAKWTMGVLNEKDWSANWIGAEAGRTAVAKATIGYHAGEAKQEDDVKWVQLDLGKPLAVSTIRLYPMRHAGVDGFGFPVRFKVEAASEENFQNPIVIADQTAADFPNPGAKPVSFDGRGTTAQFVRVTAKKLGKFTTFYCFALCELEVISGGTNVALNATVTSKDSVENFGWGKAGLIDGVFTDDAEKSKIETVLLRREFMVKPGLRRALVHVCGLGQYELSINGKKSGDDFLSPGWSKYDQTCLYDSRDITSLLTEGKNAAGLFLGNGMYNVHGGRYTKFTGTFGPPKAIAQVRLDYADGSTEIIGTDERWRVAAGPITFSSIYGGEDFDARLEQRGWDAPGFAASNWNAAAIINGPGGALRGQSCAAAPLRFFETLKPVSTKEITSGVMVYDFGQNAAMSLRLRVRGPAGSAVKITPSELVNADGSVNRGSAGGGDAHWLYTLRGEGSGEYESHFWYHGSRYFQVERTGAKPGDDLPAIELIEAPVVQSASAPAGDFSCSFDLFNRIHTLVRWAQRANMVSVLTDCPHRERLGWLEQYHLNGPSLRYEWNLAQLFTKSMNDMADSQLANGLIPDIAPEYVVFSGGFRDSPEWGSAFVLVPWQQYEFCGDLELLRRHYDGMKRYVEYLGSKSKDHLVSHGLGDWYDLGPKPPGYAQLTPIPLTATAFYFQDATILARTAALLGKADDAKHFESLAADIRAAFNAKFFDTKKRCYATGAQCANAIPLVMNLAAPENRAAVVNAIIEDIRAHGNGLTAGDVGYRYLLRALADAGRSDVIFAMNAQTNKPGYGLQLARGATSLTEAWDANPGSSQNHFMLGQINEWFYHDLAGIQHDPAGPGFKKIIIKPAIVGDLTWVTAHYDSIHGRISSSWKLEKGNLTLVVSIPANTTATVFVPSKDAAGTTEAGKLAAQSEGVTFLRMEDGCAVFAVGSGDYEFTMFGI